MSVLFRSAHGGTAAHLRDLVLPDVPVRQFVMTMPKRLRLVLALAAQEEVIAEMTPAEKDILQVIVAGSHQARERSMVMQYFRKRLNEPPQLEERVAYAENAMDEKAALTLVGMRRFDRALAGAFFGDKQRMQSDLLADAAAARLGAITFPLNSR